MSYRDFTEHNADDGPVSLSGNRSGPRGSWLATPLHRYTGSQPRLPLNSHPANGTRPAQGHSCPIQSKAPHGHDPRARPSGYVPRARIHHERSAHRVSCPQRRRGALRLTLRAVVTSPLTTARTVDRRAGALVSAWIGFTNVNKVRTSCQSQVQNSIPPSTISNQLHLLDLSNLAATRLKAQSAGP